MINCANMTPIEYLKHEYENAGWNVTNLPSKAGCVDMLAYNESRVHCIMVVEGHKKLDLEMTVDEDFLFVAKKLGASPVVAIVYAEYKIIGHKTRKYYRVVLKNGRDGSYIIVNH